MMNLEYFVDLFNEPKRKRKSKNKKKYQNDDEDNL